MGRSVVHVTAVNAFVDLVRRAGLDLDSMVAGLSFTVDRLPALRWVPWDDYCVMVDRLELAVGGPEPLSRVGFENELYTTVRKLAAAFVSPLQLFRFIFQVIDPIVFPTVAFELDVLDARRLRIAYRIELGHRGSAAFGYGSIGPTRAIPTFIGLPPATVEATIAERSGELLVRLPASRTLLARAAKRTRAAVETMLSLSSALTLDRLELDARPPLDQLIADATVAYALTPRQMEVARLVAQGLSNKEVAATLACAENTVEFHVSALMRKVGVSSRAQLIIKLWSFEGAAARSVPRRRTEANGVRSPGHEE